MLVRYETPKSISQYITSVCAFIWNHKPKLGFKSSASNDANLIESKKNEFTWPQEHTGISVQDFDSEIAFLDQKGAVIFREHLHKLIYVEEIEDYLVVYLKNDNDEVYVEVIQNSLANLMQKLKTNQGKQLYLHVSYLINLAFVEYISGNILRANIKLYFIGNDILLSRNAYLELKNRLDSSLFVGFKL